MPKPQCAWDSAHRENLAELSIPSIKSGFRPSGETIVLVCPEHREQVNAHFKMVERCGFRNSVLAYTALGLSVVIQSVAWTGVAGKLVYQLPWWLLGLGIYNLFIPYSSRTLYNYPSIDKYARSSLQRHIKAHRVLSLCGIGLFILTSIYFVALRK